MGKFAGTQGNDRTKIEKWCSEQLVGGGPIVVRGVNDVVDQALGAAAAKQYRDDPVIVAMKVLQAAGRLALPLPDDIGAGLVPEALMEDP